MLPESTRVCIMALTRASGIDPSLAHAIRVQTNKGRVSPGQAQQFIELLKQLLPPKP